MDDGGPFGFDLFVILVHHIFFTITTRSLCTQMRQKLLSETISGLYWLLVLVAMLGDNYIIGRTTCVWLSFDISIAVHL